MYLTESVWKASGAFDLCAIALLGTKSRKFAALYFTCHVMHYVLTKHSLEGKRFSFKENAPIMMATALAAMSLLGQKPPVKMLRNYLWLSFFIKTFP